MSRAPSVAWRPPTSTPPRWATASRASLPRWEEALGREDARERPDDDTWSPTEYACHVRDVFRVFAGRAALMLEQDDPQFENWDQDETAVADHYDTQDPADVAPQLVEAGERVADVFDAVPADQWTRAGRRSDGAPFTVATLAQYFIHDIEHHLHDVRA